MSSETRTMLVVLLVCGFLMCGCIVLPIGVGLGFFYMAAERSQTALAQAAIARDQAVAARAQAEAQAAQDALQRMSSTLPVEPSPAEKGPPVTVSPIQLPPLGGLAGGDLSGVPQIDVEALLADVEQRKQFYPALKQIRDFEALAQAQGNVDPNVSALTAAFKQQMQDRFKQMGFTQELIDKVLAEGDREGW